MVNFKNESWECTYLKTATISSCIEDRVYNYCAFTKKKFNTLFMHLLFQEMLPFLFKKSMANLPKITQFHNPSFSQENILWLHVSVKNPMRVQVIQSFYKLTSYRPDL